MKTICSILASGFSTRFGRNKLLYKVHEKPLICYLFDQIPFEYFDEVQVITQYKEVCERAKEYGISSIINKNAHLGISNSIQLALKDCDQMMFVVADQPNLKKETIIRLIRNSDGKHIVSCEINHCLLNPMIFPSSYFDDLRKLTGDRGGKMIAMKQDCICVAVEPDELVDVDFIGDIAKIKR